MHQGHKAAQRRLQAADAEGCQAELAQFVHDGMGRMVGGNSVDSAVAQAVSQRLNVSICAQGRIDLSVGIIWDRAPDVPKRDSEGVGGSGASPSSNPPLVSHSQ